MIVEGETRVGEELDGDGPDLDGPSSGDADALLVWNGMVARVGRYRAPNAPATTPTRPAEAAEPVRARPAPAPG